MRPDPSRSFRWRDGERTVVYGRGALAQAADLIPGGATLLSTERALASAPELAANAGSVHLVPPGLVDRLAADLRPLIGGEWLIALGGGRVIDVAKALAAADPPRRVIAVPTTLSGAEMTGVHRHAAGVAADAPRVRPAVIVCDPGLAATQPPAELADSAANALAHAIEGPLTPLGNPVSALTAHAAAVLLRDGLRDAAQPDRDALALGSLLAGAVIGATHYGLHHVLSQTLVRFAGLAHGRANAIMLPHTTVALARRAPEDLAALDRSLGEPVAAVAARFRDLGGEARLSAYGVTATKLDECAEQAAGRAELALTPPAASRDELRELYARAG